MTIYTNASYVIDELLKTNRVLDVRLGFVRADVYEFTIIPMYGEPFKYPITSELFEDIDPKLILDAIMKEIS